MGRNAQQDLGDLREWLDLLLALGWQLAENSNPSDVDHFGSMCWFFLKKAIEHAHSILTLGASRDSKLIARSMLEGMWQLLWAAGKDPEARALRWRAFSYVHDWRELQGQKAAGKPVDVKRVAEIRKGLRKHGDQFLTKKQRVAKQKGKPLKTDPYCKNWTGYTAWKIAKEVKGEVTYLELYRPFSEWQHWGPAGFGNAIARRGNQIEYIATSPEDSATALAIGFQCLLQMAQVADQHFKMGKSSEIAQLRNEYIAWYEGRGKA